MSAHWEPAEYLERWAVLDTWSVEVLALPSTLPMDATTMREAARIGLVALVQYLASNGVTVALSCSPAG